MSDNSPFLSHPPINDDLLKTENDDSQDMTNKMSDIWKNHMDLITTTTGYVVAHDRFDDSKQEVAITQVRSLPEDRRDQLQNAANGTIIYNLTTQKFNVRENGAWWALTLVPA